MTAKEIPDYDRGKAKRYANQRYLLTGLTSLYWLAFLLLFLAGGASAALKEAAFGIAGAGAGGQTLYLLGFIVITSVALLPLGYYQGYVIEHRFELSNQTTGGWLSDEAKTTALSAVIFIPLGLGAYYLLAQAGPYWWLYGAVSWTAFTFVLAYLAPVVIMPLFNKFEPVEEETLKNAILALAGRARVGISEVLKADMSRRTKKANAFFAGAGSTRRIVLGDTLLDYFENDEVLTVVGHEMGHWRLGHLTKNTLLGAVTALIGFFFADLTLRTLSGPMDLDGVADIAGLPLIILTFIVLGIAGMPLMNGVSRRFEREADTFELKLVGKPAAAISTFEKLAALNLADPDPHPLVEFWLFSHPSIKSRIATARTYLTEES